MPSRRQIRESAIQFLYCSDLEGGADPAALRGPFWEFVTETDRRNLQIATFRTIHHLAHGREERLSDFVTRAQPALAHLAALPQAEQLKEALNRLLAFESSWSLAFSRLGKFPKTGEDSSAADEFARDLESFFGTDRDLAFHRDQFLRSTADFPSLKSHLEPVTASVRRLQRISDRLRMVEHPENFPDQADLSKLRESKSELTALRNRTDELVDAILSAKEELDSKLATIIENFSPTRIDPVDRAILRLGTYELIHTETPPKVVINEAIELAKRFGTTDSGRFVNGILDKVANG
ncbi:MAG: transcription antitermination factor NusB [Verrucomicrobiota bacterium]|jgi:N utilization substance protein B